LCYALIALEEFASIPVVTYDNLIIIHQMARKLLLYTLTGAVLLCFLNIGEISIYILDEARNAACAKEMFFRNDMVVPTFNGELRGDKPPLHYYFMMASYAVFGVTPFAARFFSAIMGIITFITCIIFTGRYYGSQLAVWTAMGLLSSMLFMLEFHLSVPDPYLITFFLLANICFFVSFHEQRTWMLVPAYIFLGIAVLAKGPVALVLTAFGWLFFIIAGKLNFWQTLKRFQLPWGILLLALVALPWYIMVHIETDGEWTRAFFMDHNLNRFTSTREGHGGIPFLSLPITIAVMFPLGLLLPRIIWHTFRSKQDIIIKFLITMGLAPMIFFLFSQTILPNYLMPGTPFLVMAAAIWLYHNHDRFKFRAELFILLLISLAIPFAAYIALREDNTLASIANYAWWLSVVPVGVIIGVFVMARKPQKFLVICGTYMLALGILLIVLFPRIDRLNPVYKSASIWQKPVEKMYYGRINPSFVFYIPEPIPKIDGSYTGSEPVLIFSRSDYADSLASEGLHEVFRGRNLFETGETVIYSNVLSGGATTLR
jgi:4-amino-4-deoxy-L-arabinose transferase-like glycosyltransferase